MPIEGTKKILAVLEDLFFTVKIHEAAKRAGLPVEFVKSERDALEKAAARLGLLEAHLAGREFLLERFSVADAYLVTVLGWAPVTPVDLAKWPAVAGYVERMRLRPSVAKAYAEELGMYLKTEAHRKTA